MNPERKIGCIDSFYPNKTETGAEKGYILQDSLGPSYSLGIGEAVSSTETIPMGHVGLPISWLTPLSP